MLKTNQEKINIFFIFSTSLVYSIIPTKDYFEYMTVLIFFILLIPIIYNKMYNSNKLSYEKTLNRNNMINIIFLFILSLAITFLIIKNTQILDNYNISYFALNNYNMFVFYYGVIILPIIFIYNYFLNNFIIKININVLNNFFILLLQFIVLFIIIISNKSSFYLYIPYMIFLPFAFIIRKKSGNFIYSTIFQLLYVIIYDLYFMIYYI